MLTGLWFNSSVPPKEKDNSEIASVVVIGCIYSRGLLLTWYCYIHSCRIFPLHLFKSTTTQRRSRLEHWYCVGVNRPKHYSQLRVKDLWLSSMHIVFLLTFLQFLFNVSGHLDSIIFLKLERNKGALQCSFVKWWLMLVYYSHILIGCVCTAIVRVTPKTPCGWHMNMGELLWSPVMTPKVKNSPKCMYEAFLVLCLKN